MQLGLMGTPVRACVRGNLWELTCGVTPCVRWQLMGTYGNFVRSNLRACVATHGNLWELCAE